MRKLSFLNILFLLIVISDVYSEINEAQKKIIKSQIILIHEGMVSEKEVFRKAKLFDKDPDVTLYCMQNQIYVFN